MVPRRKHSKERVVVFAVFVVIFGILGVVVTMIVFELGAVAEKVDVGVTVKGRHGGTQARLVMAVTAAAMIVAPPPIAATQIATFWGLVSLA